MQYWRLARTIGHTRGHFPARAEHRGWRRHSVSSARSNRNEMDSACDANRGIVLHWLRANPCATSGRWMILFTLTVLCTRTLLTHSRSLLACHAGGLRDIQKLLDVVLIPRFLLQRYDQVLWPSSCVPCHNPPPPPLKVRGESPSSPALCSWARLILKNLCSGLSKHFRCLREVGMWDNISFLVPCARLSPDL